jgi:hypothetical protein
MSIFVAEDVTPTGFNFTAILPAQVGAYDVVLQDAQGGELGREANGITVTPIGLSPGYAAITPNATTVGMSTNFIVTGGSLTQIAVHWLSRDGVDLVTALPLGLTDDRFVFVWNPVPMNVGTLDLIGRDAAGNELTRLDDCIVVS